MKLNRLLITEVFISVTKLFTYKSQKELLKKLEVLLLPKFKQKWKSAGALAECQVGFIPRQFVRPRPL